MDTLEKRATLKLTRAKMYVQMWVETLRSLILDTLFFYHSVYFSSKGQWVVNFLVHWGKWDMVGVPKSGQYPTA